MESIDNKDMIIAGAYADAPLPADERLEGEEGLEISSEMPSDDNVYPNADVRVAKDQYSLLHIKRLVEVRGELIIDPDYQRQNVWSARQRIELIESIIMGIPLPVIYLFETRDGKKQVVDGRQRITTIIDFLNDKFPLKDLRILRDYNDCRFSDLPPKVQGIFEDFQILCYVIQPPTAERVKYDIFDRVNRGGTKLNSQEMRNALYRGAATELINEICEEEIFAKASDHSISPKRMRDRYAALRILAFYLYFSGMLGDDDQGRPIRYRSDNDDFLAKTMVWINTKSTPAQREEWKEVILGALREIHSTLKDDAFRFVSGHGKKRAINMPLMEILTFLFTLVWSRPEEGVVKSRIETLKKVLDAEGGFRTKVDSSVSVNKRFGRIVRFISTDLDPAYDIATIPGWENSPLSNNDLNL